MLRRGLYTLRFHGCGTSCCGLHVRIADDRDVSYQAYIASYTFEEGLIRTTKKHNAHICIHMYTCLHLPVYLHIWTYTHMYRNIYIYTYVHICALQFLLVCLGTMFCLLITQVAHPLGRPARHQSIGFSKPNPVTFATHEPKVDLVRRLFEIYLAFS